MSYFLQTTNGTRYQIDIVEKITFNFPNAIIVYESLGENGGYVINNGRMNSSLDLNIKLKIPELSNAFSVVNQLKNITGPVILGGLKGSGKIFGKYVIKGLPGNIDAGDNRINMDINLVEYRQANSKSELLNLTYQGDAIYTFLKQLNFNAGNI